MNIVVLQVILTITIFLLTLLCMLLPLRIYPRDRTLQVNRKSERIMAFCNCVSGGVFLGVCFMGLMPFCREKFQSSFEMIGLQVDYPLSELGVVLGFFLILVVEQSIQVCQSKRSAYDEPKEMLETSNAYLIYSTESDLSGDSESDFEVPQASMSAEVLGDGVTETTAMLAPQDSPDQLSQCDSEQLRAPSQNGDIQQAQHQHSTSSSAQAQPPVPTCSASKTGRRNRRSRSRLSRTQRSGRHRARGHHNHHLHHHGHSHSKGADVGGEHGHSHMLDVLSQNSGLRCFILMIALGIHAVFEGLALGLQDEMGKLINLYIGVIVHESLVSFAMGISLARQRLRLGTVIKLSLLLCAMIPIGIVIGLAIGVVHTFAGSITSAILQAIAAGTFLYVIFLEIIPPEVNDPNDRLLKVFFLFFGFGLVACLQVVQDGH